MRALVGSLPASGLCVRRYLVAVYENHVTPDLPYIR